MPVLCSVVKDKGQMYCTKFSAGEKIIQLQQHTQLSFMHFTAPKNDRAGRMLRAQTLCGFQGARDRFHEAKEFQREHRAIQGIHCTELRESGRKSQRCDIFINS